MAGGIKGQWNGLVGDLKHTATKTIPEAFKTTGEAIGGAAAGTGRAGRAAAGIGAAAVKKPIEWGIGGMRWLVKPFEIAFRRAPVLSTAATAAAGVWAVGSAVHNGRAKKTREAMAAGQPAYGLAPGEFDATVAPQLRQGGGKAGGFAAGVQAERAAQGQNVVS